MRHLGKIRFGFALVVCAFLTAQAASAQVSVEGVQFQNLFGNIGFGYDGQTGLNEPSSHDFGVTGNLNTSGFYYNPSFLAFQANTFYSRADSSEEAATLSDSKGVNLGSAIFGGTTFPGFASFGANWGASSSYGLPGLTGLNATSNNRNFSVSWMFRDLPVKNLSVYFADNMNDTTIPGVGFSSDSSSKGFGIATGGYKFAGFSLAGGYQYSLSDVTSNVSGADGGSVSSHGSSDVFHVMSSRSLPGHGEVTLAAYRIMTEGSSEGDKGNSDSDEFDASISSHVWRIPLAGSISYNDNVYGSVLQQLNASGQLVDQSYSGPKIAELNMSLYSSYVLPHRIFLTGYATREEEFVMGQSASALAFGGNVSYAFGKFIKGLTVTVGMHDVADRAGNEGAGVIANANYRRNLGAWVVQANAGYNQSIQTMLALNTESSGGASVEVRRNLGDKASFGANAGYGRSLFSNTNGQFTEEKNAGMNLSWMRQTLSAFYSEAGGNAIITSQGLVASTTPGLTGSQVVPYSGKSYTAGYANTLIKNLNLHFAWSKFVSTGSGAGLFSNVSAEGYNGGLMYVYHKTNFIANFAHNQQGASVTNSLPSNVTVFYVGLSRWFNFF